MLLPVVFWCLCCCLYFIVLLFMLWVCLWCDVLAVVVGLFDYLLFVLVVFLCFVCFWFVWLLLIWMLACGFDSVSWFTLMLFDLFGCAAGRFILFDFMLVVCLLLGFVEWCLVVCVGLLFVRWFLLFCWVYWCWYDVCCVFGDAFWLSMCYDFEFIVWYLIVLICWILC